jgi:hypothetical protein
VAVRASGPSLQHRFKHIVRQLKQMLGESAESGPVDVLGEGQQPIAEHQRTDGRCEGDRARRIGKKSLAYQGRIIGGPHVQCHTANNRIIRYKKLSAA